MLPAANGRLYKVYATSFLLFNSKICEVRSQLRRHRTFLEQVQWIDTKTEARSRRSVELVELPKQELRKKNDKWPFSVCRQSFRCATMVVVGVTRL